jgi:hypothetical protein
LVAPAIAEVRPTVDEDDERAGFGATGKIETRVVVAFREVLGYGEEHKRRPFEPHDVDYKNYSSLFEVQKREGTPAPGKRKCTTNSDVHLPTFVIPAAGAVSPL